MNRNRNGFRITRAGTPIAPFALIALVLGLAGCHQKSILSDPAVIKHAADAGPEYETLVMQAGNWEKPATPAPGTPDGDLHIAESLFRAEDYSKAAKAYEEVAEKHKDSVAVHERALFMKAEAEYQQNAFRDAYDDFQLFVKAYPGSRHHSAAMQRVFAIADYWLEDARRDVRLGKPSSIRRFLHFDTDKKPLFDEDGHAVHALEYVRERDPNGPLADDSLMIAAGYEFSTGNFKEADLLLDRLVHDYPHSEHQARAHLLSAEAKLQSYKGTAYDNRKLEEARRTLRSAMAQFPDELEPERQRILHELDEIRQEQAKSQYEVGEWYQRRGDRSTKDADKMYGAARYYYQYVQKGFPGTKWADRAAERLAQLPPAPTPKEDAAAK